MACMLQPEAPEEDHALRPVPADLYRQVEAEAGTVLPVTRWRHREEFCPDWDYIYSPRASGPAVAAALFCSMYVSEENWARAIAAHAHQAMALLAESGVTFRQYAQGDCDPELGGRVDGAINWALGGYEVVALFAGRPGRQARPATGTGPTELTYR